MENTKHHKTKTDSGRGMETLFRITFNNQIHLIRIADNKANSIITINALVITVLIGLSGYGSITPENNFSSLNILVPIILLLLTCLLSVIFALQATKPKIIKTKNKTDVKMTGSSLMFFGSIPERTLDEYLAEMDVLEHSKELIYHTMEIEIYNQSKVLNVKYKLLRIAFLIFMYGFILSVLAFGVFFLFSI
jgi:hypothetical protein